MRVAAQVAGVTYCGHSLSLSGPHCLDLTLTPWKPVLETPPTYRMWEPNSTEDHPDPDIAPQLCLRGPSMRPERANRQMGASTLDTLHYILPVEEGMFLTRLDPAAGPGNVLGRNCLTGPRRAVSSLVGEDSFLLWELAFLLVCLSCSYGMSVEVAGCPGRPGGGETITVVSRPTFPGLGLHSGTSDSSSLMHAKLVFPLGETVWELLRPEAPHNGRFLLFCSSQTPRPDILVDWSSHFF